MEEQKQRSLDKTTEVIWRAETVDALTSEELRASRIPDSSLSRAWVEFKDYNNKEYRAVYCPKYGKDPQDKTVILNTEEGKVSEVITEVYRISKGRLFGVTTLMSSFLRSYGPKELNEKSISFSVKGEITQKRVADITEALKEEGFTDVKISKVIFQEVPRQAYEHPGFPREKLAEGYNAARKNQELSWRDISNL